MFLIVLMLLLLHVFRSYQIQVIFVPKVVILGPFLKKSVKMIFNEFFLEKVYWMICFSRKDHMIWTKILKENGTIGTIMAATVCKTAV